MNKTLLIAFGVIVGIIVLFIAIFAGVRNNFVRLEENVNESWAQVENVYQRRLDLIPNLVEVVKGYASHEKETFQAVTEARAKISQMNISSDIVNNPAMISQFQQAQKQLSSGLGRLMLVAERYPDLKANQNFLNLQTQLEGTENRITVERQRYNKTAKIFNTEIRMFPKNFIASMMNLSKKEYFKADEGAAKVPKVSFK